MLAPSQHWNAGRVAMASCEEPCTHIWCYHHTNWQQHCPSAMPSCMAWPKAEQGELPGLRQRLLSRLTRGRG